MVSGGVVGLAHELHKRAPSFHRGIHVKTTFGFLLASTLVLAGCSESDATSPSPSPTDSDASTDTGLPDASDAGTPDSSDAESAADSTPDSPDGAVDQLPTAAEWAERVESFYGAAPEVSDRLATFDAVWTTLSDQFAGFGPLDVDWDATRTELRPLAEAATTNGRFFQVVSEMVTRLPDMHTVIHSMDVCRIDNADFFAERPPIFIQYYQRSRLGICVMPIDGELVVYRTAADQLTGLQLGDAIVSLDGVAPEEILNRLDGWKLPTCGSRGSTPASDKYARMAELLHDNVHLFTTIQVRRHGSTEIESLDTESWLKSMSLLACSDQLPIGGVSFPWTEMPMGAPNIQDLTWGKVEGTNVGYIYVYGTSSKIATLFDNAVTELWDTDGLIIDIRFNSGGIMPIDSGGSMDAGIRRLFQTEIPDMFQFGQRDSTSTDRKALTIVKKSTLKADSSTYFDHPIAVLTGPRAGSGGDFAAYALAHHPRARRFGLPTMGAFGSQCTFEGSDDILGAFACGAAMDSSSALLQASVQTPDETVWLTAEDIAKGTDTVVQSALTWIAASQ